MFFHLKLNAEFHGIDAIKRKAQNELLAQVAVLYCCSQIFFRSILYFMIPNELSGTQTEPSAKCEITKF